MDTEKMGFDMVLFKIDSNLTQEDLECLKFLCTDLLPGKRLVTIKSNLELFEELKKFNLIDEEDHFLLKELLYTIGQNSLLKNLNTNQHIVQESLSKNGVITLYRRMLFELYENITKEDLKQIKFLLNIPSKYKENKTFLDILCYLEKQEKISENNLEVLEKAFKNISQELIKTINIYKKNRELQRTTQQSLHSEDEFEDLPKLSLQVSSPTVSSIDMEFPSDVMSSVREHIQEVRGPANEEDLKTENTENCLSNLSLNDQPAVEKYAMNRKNRGYCLIISNSEFSKSDPRPGTEKDVEFLKNVFIWLGLHVEIQNELSSQDIRNCMKHFQDLDHTDQDCFVCCILTHGQSRAVLGTDNTAIPITDIVSYFSCTSCKTLAGKPKLFFIQACQGEKIQSAHEIEADATKPADDEKCVVTIPNSADMLIGMSTVDGYYSFRHVQQGTWYIQALCENLTKMVPIGEDILTILTKVNKDVSEKEYTKFGRRKMKQMPQPAYTLTKKLVFPNPPTPYTSTSQ